MNANNMTEIFGEPISRYTRRQAIDDGILVQLSGDGYEGDEWIPKMCAEAGYRIPVAMTTTAFVACVMPLEESSEQLAPCQDPKGRLWDVLFVMRLFVARRVREVREGSVRFNLSVRQNVPRGSKLRGRQKTVTLKAVLGGDDDGRPCITIMFPHES